MVCRGYVIMQWILYIYIYIYIYTHTHTHECSSKFSYDKIIITTTYCVVSYEMYALRTEQTVEVIKKLYSRISVAKNSRFLPTTQSGGLKQGLQTGMTDVTYVRVLMWMCLPRGDMLAKHPGLSRRQNCSVTSGGGVEVHDTCCHLRPCLRA
jgi:hypothetical protein